MAAVTVALTPPINTIFSAGVVEKPVPVILIEEPTVALFGLNEEIVGAGIGGLIVISFVAVHALLCA